MSSTSYDTYTSNNTAGSFSARPNRNNESVNALENGMARLNSSIATTTVETNEVTWINLLLRYDRKLGGSLFYLCFRFIDIALLFIGLSSAYSACSLSNHLATTSICLLIFYFIDLIIIFVYLIRCQLASHSQLTDEEKTQQYRRIAALRSFISFCKLLPVCFGASYTLTAKLSTGNDCELMRFCLGIVCISSLITMIMPPTKPVIPTRRSFLTECFLLSFVLINNGTYLITVLLSMKDVQQSSCIYQNPEDIYLRAPLKSFAYLGVLLYSCMTAMYIIHMFVSQVCHRLRNGRRFYIYYYALQYTINYLGALGVIYYLSIGALILFQPRSGQPCRAEAPGLYRTLLIWQWIRILSPLIAVPLVLILCCLGVFFGFILSYCLPASITVPLLEVIRSWISAAPVQINRSPPATQENIDAIPVVLFGQESDQFNQTDCAICRSDFEANEPVKKLECGHLFHSQCVANWLLITRICPVCRQRMSSATT